MLITSLSWLKRFAALAPYWLKRFAALAPYWLKR
jgi:hypothetical protein